MVGIKRQEFMDSLDHKEYIGDGVYAGIRGDGVSTLYTDDGIEINNVIYLDDSVQLSLYRYLQTYFGWNVK
jgi:hypothetical protein